MRKRLLLTFLCAYAFGCVCAQSLLKEGFEGDTFPPAGWTTIDDKQITIAYDDLFGTNFSENVYSAGIRYQF